MIYRKTILIFAAITTIFLAGCLDKIEGQEEDLVSTESLFIFEETEFDFGVIKQSGGIVSYDFEFEYIGDDSVVVEGVPTSCACTTAKISQTNLKKGDKGVLTVFFDPNLHEEPEGKFFKMVSLLTNPQLDNLPELKIWVEIDLDLGSKFFKLNEPHDDEDEHTDGIAYHKISAEEFTQKMTNKDFFLLDVHVPEQEHIEGTDAAIPYTEIKKNFDNLPKDLSEEIIVYCRSGSMSLEASRALTELGYKNVFNLVGGRNAYLEFNKQ